MAEIINTFKQNVPEMRFIGKKYSEVGHWGEWFANGWFDEIEKLMGGTSAILKLWDNGGAYIGMERHKIGEPFEYWIGMFTPSHTEVTDHFQYVDFEESNLGICWIYGKEDEVHDTRRCKQMLENQGIEIISDKNGAIWSFENCLCPRFTTPDEKGNIILDYCYFVR
jgi:hypothetical protein